MGAQLLEELAKSYRTITTVGLVIGVLGNSKNGNIVLTHHHRHHHHWFNVIFPRFSTDCTVSHEFHTSMLHDVSDWQAIWSCLFSTRCPSYIHNESFRCVATGLGYVLHNPCNLPLYPTHTAPDSSPFSTSLYSIYVFLNTHVYFSLYQLYHLLLSLSLSIRSASHACICFLV